MTKYTRVPAISGKQLIALLQQDGWVVKRRATHGLSMAKSFSDRTRVTVIPDTRASLDGGTLAAILGPKQTNIGKKGLLELINRFGI
ncbi:MAG: hypothetical protein HY665_06175 [Chloroflexi bacterium]|nr:hypothetical protein [Chloroflexota bacterium]